MQRKLDRICRHHAVLAAAVAGLMNLACTPDANSQMGVPFQHAGVRFEQNATDGDVEVVFEVTSGDEGLADLTIVGPGGRTVTEFHAPDSSTLGIRSFRFESPEPSDVERLEAAYPEGIYRFAATTVSGDDLAGQATLSHGLPATVTFMHPAEEEEDVAVRGLEMSWSAVPGVTHYLIEIEQDETGVSLSLRLTSAATTFMIPDGFLQPDTEYQLAIGTVSRDGNVSYVETSFTTAG